MHSAAWWSGRRAQKDVRRGRGVRVRGRDRTEEELAQIGAAAGDVAADVVRVVLLELAGVGVPSTMQGRSLLPLLRGEPAAWRTSFLVEYWSDKVFPRIANMGYRAVRTECWKWTDYLELPGMDELYDLQADPYEMANVFDAPRTQAVRDELRAELARLLRETAAPGSP